MDKETRLSLSVCIQGILIVVLCALGAISTIQLRTDIKELREQVAAITQVEEKVAPIPTEAPISHGIAERLDRLARIERALKNNKEAEDATKER